MQWATSCEFCFICYILKYSLSQICILVSLPHAPIPIAPYPPRMLTMTGAPTGRAVELNWLPPLHPNGAIHYEIEYKPAMIPGDPVNAGSSNSLYFTLTLPSEIETHRVTVVAVNSKGRARSNELEVVVTPEMDTETGILYMHHAHVCCNDITLRVYMCAYVCMRVYMHVCVHTFNVQLASNLKVCQILNHIYNGNYIYQLLLRRNLWQGYTLTYYDSNSLAKNWFNKAKRFNSYTAVFISSIIRTHPVLIQCVMVIGSVGNNV